MRINGRVPMPNGGAGPDPVADPEDVPDELIVVLPDRPPGADQLTRRIILTLEGPAAETVTMELHVLDELPRQALQQERTTQAVGDRSFHLLATGVVVTSRTLTEVVTAMPGGGPVYFRQTGDTLTSDGVLLVAVAT